MMKIKFKRLRAIILLLLNIIFIFCLSSCIKQLDDITEPKVVDPPYGLEVTATKDGQLLRWYDDSNREDGYIIQKRINKTGSFERIATLPANATTYIDTFFILDRTAYIEYRLYSFRADSFSEPIMISYTPDGFSSPYNLILSGFTDGSINLIWTDQNTFESGFIIERKANTGDFETIARVEHDVKEFTDFKIEKDGNYEYRVAAMFGDVASEYSNILKVWYGLTFDSSERFPSDGYIKQFTPTSISKDYIIFNSTTGLKYLNIENGIEYSLPGNQNQSAISPDGKTFITCGDNSDINLWDAKTGNLVKTLYRQDYSYQTHKIAINSDNSLVAVLESSSETYVRVFDLKTGAIKWERKSLLNDNMVLSFNINGELIYTNEFNTLRMVKANNDSLIFLFNQKNAFKVVFNKSGKYAAVLSKVNMNNVVSGSIFIYDIQNKVYLESIKDVIPFDAFYSESEEALHYIGYNKGWNVCYGNLKSPPLMFLEKNIYLIPQTNLLLAFEGSGSGRIIRLKNSWVSSN